jgi:hypothetical protein
MSGNSPSNAYLTNQNSLSVDHSLIEGGPATTYVASGVNWGEGNIFEAPHFVMDHETLPDYYLSEHSPAINVGTQDTTGLNLPEFDLAGNPRIYDGRIDMGCYEWQGEVANNPNDIPVPNANLTVYPNPFNPETNIRLTTKKEGKAKLQIFNIKGQLVNTLIDSYMAAGEHNIRWHGEDMNNQRVASGQYFLKFTQDGDVLAKKMLLLK